MKGLGADSRYWQALSEGRLELPQCAKCDSWRWPAPFRCSDCGSWDFRWVPIPLSGTLYSWTRVHHRFAGTECLSHPYVTASVELPQAGAIRLFGLLEPGDTAKIGLSVEGEIRTTLAMGRDIPAIVWRPAA